VKFDSNLDEKLFSKDFESDGIKIVVSVHSYNNGPKNYSLSGRQRMPKATGVLENLGA